MTIRVMRLWQSGIATPVWAGLSSARALAWIRDSVVQRRDSDRLWLEDEKRPAVALDSSWRPRK